MDIFALPLRICLVSGAPKPSTPSASCVMAPPAVSVIVPSLVTICSFTAMSPPATSTTGAPTVPPLPSIWSLTVMSPPAVAVSAEPFCKLMIGAVMAMSAKAFSTTGPVLSSMPLSTLMEPPVEVRLSVLAVA